MYVSRRDENYVKSGVFFSVSLNRQSWRGERGWMEQSGVGVSFLFFCFLLITNYNNRPYYHITRSVLTNIPGGGGLFRFSGSVGSARALAQPPGANRS